MHWNFFLGPSKSGKTVALISAILDQYRTASGESVFERIIVMSPSIEIDDAWKPVKHFIEHDMGVNTDREHVYFDKWDEGALRTIIEQQKKITRTTKEMGFKKLYQILIVIDDFADQPELHRRTGDGALDTLFIRGRHMQISTWVSSQKLRLISAAVRVNMQFMCVWRLRNQLELEAVLEELTALLPKKELQAIYEEAIREPYSFLFIHYLKPRSEMFYKRWVDSALGSLNWATLPVGAYTGTRLAAWISSNYAAATYVAETNEIQIAYDGNRRVLNDSDLRDQFPDIGRELPTGRLGQQASLHQPPFGAKFHRRSPANPQLRGHEPIFRALS